MSVLETPERVRKEIMIHMDFYFSYLSVSLSTHSFLPPSSLTRVLSLDGVSVLISMG